MCRTSYSQASSGRCPRRVLRPLHAQANAVLFDSGSMDGELVDHEKVRERKSKLENKMRNFHGSTFLPCEAVTHSPRKTTTSMNNVRAHYRFPYKHKGRKHLRAFTVRGTMLLSNAGSSSLTTRGGFVCGEESTNSRDKFSDIWVWR
jgi:hypothetical protein